MATNKFKWWVVIIQVNNGKNTHNFFLASSESFWDFRKMYTLGKVVSVPFSSHNIASESFEKSAFCD